MPIWQTRIITIKKVTLSYVLLYKERHKMSRFSRFTNNIKVLQQELKSIKSQPLEGFRIEDNEDNIFKWQIGVFGPPGTIYEGGYFKGAKIMILVLLKSLRSA